jgi:hypothetical protein
MIHPVMHSTTTINVGSIDVAVTVLVQLTAIVYSMQLHT